MKDYYIHICDACLTASCWHGEFTCDDSRDAGIKKMKKSELDQLNREHPSCYSVDKLTEVCGQVEFVEGSQ